MRNVALYVKDILQYMREAEEFIEGLQYDEFAVDKKTFNAVARAIEVIGEAAKKHYAYLSLHMERNGGRHDNIARKGI